jgi:NAD(P)-dependent dehydrogenase (short-subunit alcohol dehydrogenase family)
MGSSGITREHPARVALVTGAARGIGRTVALALARDGRVVAVADLLEPQAQEVAGEIELAGGHALAIELDVTDPASVASGALLPGMTASSPDSERLVSALERAVPMRRLGRPEDTAAAVAFLACEDAGYITGQTLSVSGGLTMA